MAQGIFLSYRRAEAGPYARLLKRQLSERFPDANVFMDLDSIEAGLDFAEAIRDAVDSSAVMVTLIGREWATITDDEGHLRLDDPDDYVRFEVKTALQRGVRVIPVLLDGAMPPQQRQLPDELQKLARLNALELTYGRYEYDVSRLLDVIQRVLTGAPGASVRSPGISPARAAQLLSDAERAAKSIPAEISRVRALSDVARALSARYPEHAAQVIEEAIGIARSIDNEDTQGGALMAVAKALAVIDPARAEHVARSVRGETAPEALWVVANALAATVPARAERIAQSVDPHSRIFVLLNIAQRIAPIDPDKAARLLTDAEHAAQSITTEYMRPNDLAVVASALAATDPSRAERLFAEAERSARSITNPVHVGWKAATLADVAKSLAHSDPDNAARLFADAERTAQSITSENNRDTALREVATALAAIDPDQAERIAQSTSGDGATPNGIRLRIASALAASNPDRAERMLRSIPGDGVTKARALADVASALAAADPDRAERVARSITDERWKVNALAAIAEAQN
jgi:TIR domain